MIAKKWLTDYDKHMGIDSNFGLKFNLPDEMLEKLRQDADKKFNAETGLHVDVLSGWPLHYQKNPAPYYEEYFRKEHPQIFDYIMAKSSPAKVAEYNLLADEYNTDLQRLNAEEWGATKVKFLERVLKLVMG